MFNASVDFALCVYIPTNLLYLAKEKCPSCKVTVFIIVSINMVVNHKGVYVCSQCCMYSFSFKYIIFEDFITLEPFQVSSLWRCPDFRKLVNIHHLGPP